MEVNFAIFLIKVTVLKLSFLKTFFLSSCLGLFWRLCWEKFFFTWRLFKKFSIFHFFNFSCMNFFHIMNFFHFFHIFPCSKFLMYLQFILEIMLKKETGMYFFSYCLLLPALSNSNNKINRTARQTNTKNMEKYLWKNNTCKKDYNLNRMQHEMRHFYKYFSFYLHIIISLSFNLFL